MRILISACLLGSACRYDGMSKGSPWAEALAGEHQLVPVCPEQLGGLPTPRVPSEKTGGRVMTKDGADVTEQYLRGAQETLRLCRILGCEAAILKERSPSCGSGEIYDGTFTGTLTGGWGVTADLLRSAGIPVWGESRIPDLLTGQPETEHTQEDHKRRGLQMRRTDREITDLAQIRDILSEARIVHLGMVDGEKPYVVPMHYGYSLEGEKLVLYVHSALEGRKLDVIARNPNVFAEIDTGEILIPGGDDPCSYSAAYRSVMGEGKAVLLESASEKAQALQILMRTQTGRDFAVTEEMVGAVCVIKVELDWFTAKSRPMQKKAKRHAGAEALLELSNQELFSILAGDRGVIAQAGLHEILKEYRAEHQKIDADLQTMVREILSKEE